MLRNYWQLILVVFIALSLTAAGITIYDKMAAIHHVRRVRERTLLITAALTGCIGMYLTMHVIRHKTRKPKFMVGIPVIFLIEAAIAAALFGFGVIQW